MGSSFHRWLCVCPTVAAFESTVASPGRGRGGVSRWGPGSRTRRCGAGPGLSAPSVVCRAPGPVQKLRLHSPPRCPRLPEACAFCGQGSFGDVRPPPLQRRHLPGRVWRSCVHYRSEVALSPEKGPCWGAEGTRVLLQPLALLGVVMTSGSDLNHSDFVVSLSEAGTVAAGHYGDRPLRGQDSRVPAALPHAPIPSRLPSGAHGARTAAARRRWSSSSSSCRTSCPSRPRATCR